MQEFTYDALAGRVVFGPGAARTRLAAEVERLGADRVLLIASARDAATGARLVGAVRRAGSRPRSPRSASTSRSRPPRPRARRPREVGADAVLCIGGGSTIGAAKAVALTARIPVAGRAHHVLRLGGHSRLGADRGRPQDHRHRPGRAAPGRRLRPRAHGVAAPRPRRRERAERDGARRRGVVGAAAQPGEHAWSPRRASAALAAGLRKDDPADLLRGAWLRRRRSPSPGPGCTTSSATCWAGRSTCRTRRTHAVVLPHVLAFNAPGAPDAVGPGRPRAGRRRRRCAGLRALADELGVPARAARARPAPRTARRGRRAHRAGGPGGQPRAGRRRGAAAAGRGPRGQGDRDEDRAWMRRASRRSPTRCVASFAGTPDERLREIMESLTRHLHAFAREVRLTAGGVGGRDRVPDPGRAHHRRPSPGVHPALRRARAVHAHRRDQRARRRRTPPSPRSFGPFFVEGAPEVPLGGDIANGATGTPAGSSGTVPPPTARPSPAPASRCGRPTTTASTTSSTRATRTAGRGWLHLRAGRRVPLLVGPPDALLRSPTTARSATCSPPPARSPMRPAHLHFKVDAPGSPHPDHPHLRRRRRPPGQRRRVRRQGQPGRRRSPSTAPAPLRTAATSTAPWTSVQFDIVLERTVTTSPDGIDLQTDVLVIGSGPAGGGAALALATLGVEHMVITKYRWTANTPRAHITNQRTMEIFRDLGIEDDVLAQADTARADGRHRVLHQPRRRRDRPGPHLGHPSRAREADYTHGQPVAQLRHPADAAGADRHRARGRAGQPDPVRHRVRRPRPGRRRRRRDRPRPGHRARVRRSGPST